MGKFHDSTRQTLLRMVLLGPAVAVLWATPVSSSAQTSEPQPKQAEGFVDEGSAPAEAALIEEEVVPGADLTEASEAVRAKDFAKAEELLSAVLVEYPDDPAALLMRGEVLLALGRAADAKPLLQKCVELDPERKRANFQLASILQQTGQTQDALAHYAKEIEVTDEDEVKLMARLNRSVLFEQSRQWDDAAGELQAAIEIDPDTPQLYGDLASIYLQSGKLDEASLALTDGIEAGFSSPRHFYILGSRYFKADNFDKAATAFSQALEANPGFAEAERGLATSLDKAGRSREAAAHFQKYLDLRPDAPDAADLKKRIAAASGS